MSVLIFLGAILWDLLWGELPTPIHPVAWMGRALNWVKAKLQGASALKAGSGGLLSLMVAATLTAACGWLIEHWAYWPLQILALKSCFSLHSLRAAVLQVETAVERQDLPEARRLLSWHLVSRPTQELSPGQVRAAALESLAENTCDSLVGPWMAYALWGLPGALVYRLVNTGDSILGYRTPELEWAGKAWARCDDLFNLIPARLTALLYLGGAHRQAWSVAARDAGLTASPNAGYPMSALAGLLQVRLEKVGHYVLGREFSEPSHPEVMKGMKCFQKTWARAALLVVIALWI